MSEDRKKQFDEFIKNMRTEISDLDKKFLELSHLLRMRPSADDTKAYVSDTFLDKCYTVNTKIHQFCQQTSVNINQLMSQLLDNSELLLRVRRK